LIKPDYWILLALKNASESYGFDIKKWLQFEKPDEFKINKTEYDKLIDDLEDANLIKRATNEQINFFLTQKGKKELSEFKGHLTFDEYYLIISKFPEVEIKERIKAFENFIGFSFSLIVLVSLIRFPYSSYINNTFIIFFIVLIFSIISVIVSIYLGRNLADILVFWVFGQRENLLKIKELVWKYKNIITYIIILLAIFLLDITKSSSWINSIGAIILYKLCQVLFDKKEFF